MNRSERTYGQMLALLRDTPVATSFTEEEIQSLLETPAGQREPVAIPSAPTSSVRWIGVALVALAVSLAGLWLLPASSPVRDRLTANSPAHDATRTQRAPLPDAAAPTARPSALTGGNPIRPIPPAHRTTVAGSPGTTPHSNPARAAKHPHDVEENVELSSSRGTEISKLPMLELNREELKSIGVEFAGGEIRTIGEEYYTLATEQDRATFARMGMDTTKRTGIVRMRLTIDTAGLTTRKYSWTRVEDYSRIAPIIALNSYAGEEQSTAMALNSFNRSPIMDSAKRSITSMVNALARAFASDDIAGAMQDSDQTNPARILVPVHIHLGESSVDGTAKRRGADIILWYYPTPEFVAALPPRYRISLQKELTVIADVVECNLPPGEACSRMTGEPLLSNYCKRISGALSDLNVSPNPAHGRITMRYTLESPRTVRAALYGIRGEQVRELAPATMTGAGTHLVGVELDHVPPGAYRIVLRSERGEQVSERLIVQ